MPHIEWEHLVPNPDQDLPTVLRPFQNTDFSAFPPFVADSPSVKDVNSKTLATSSFVFEGISGSISLIVDLEASLPKIEKFMPYFDPLFRGIYPHASPNPIIVALPLRLEVATKIPTRAEFERLKDKRLVFSFDQMYAYKLNGEELDPGEVDANIYFGRDFKSRKANVITPHKPLPVILPSDPEMVRKVKAYFMTERDMTHDK